MKHPVILFVTTTPTGAVEQIQAHSQGVNYYPVAASIANGVHKFIFQIEGDEDKTPALGISVAESAVVTDRVGG